MSSSNAELANPTTDDATFQRLRDKCERFRVLIIGKANVGKTTILEKLCETDAKPIVHDRDGKLVDPEDLGKAGDNRGIHNIEHEITYASKPGLVFHDSGGFESSSEVEVNTVRDFMESRAKARSLKDQLHAIWYCLASDDDRKISASEKTFFDKSRSHSAPVIIVFTKMDDLEDKILLEVEDIEPELPPGALMEYLASDRKCLADMPFGPDGFAYVDNRNQPEESCQALLLLTQSKINSDMLSYLLVMVQQTNMELMVQSALQSIKQVTTAEKMALRVMYWMPHIIDRRHDDNRNYYHRNYLLDLNNFNNDRLLRRLNRYNDYYNYDNDPILKSFISCGFSFSSQILYKPKLDYNTNPKILASIAGYLIVCARSFWQNGNNIIEKLKHTTEQYSLFRRQYVLEAITQAAKKPTVFKKAFYDLIIVEIKR